MIFQDLGKKFPTLEKNYHMIPQYLGKKFPTLEKIYRRNIK